MSAIYDAIYQLPPFVNGGYHFVAKRNTDLEVKMDETTFFFYFSLKNKLAPALFRSINDLIGSFESLE